ncbi:MAG: hypothetical protein WDZ63_10370 [Burkholderiales bacterium]
MMRMSSLAVSLVLVLGVTGQAIAAEEGLGRLFFTPKQRAALDAGAPISRPAPKPAAAATAPRRPAPPPAPRELRLGGVVTRSDGERTVWIDGKPYHRDQPDDVRIIIDMADPATVRVQPRGTQSPIEVRVGQTLDRRTGTVREPYAPVDGDRN